MPDFHDYVYLSDRKLAAIAFNMSSLRRKIPHVKGEVRVPFASISVESSNMDPQVRGSDVPPMQQGKLNRIFDEVSEQSLWYSDRDVRPGSWIYFELPMNYCQLESTYFGSSVVFADHNELLPDSSVRVLLHGSAQHLKDRPRVIDISEDVERIRSAPQRYRVRLRVG